MLFAINRYLLISPGFTSCLFIFSQTSYLLYPHVVLGTECRVSNMLDNFTIIKSQLKFTQLQREALLQPPE